MILLEMSRDEAHGGGDWGFARCVWSPTKKRDTETRRGGRWPFWDLVGQARTGDVVLHLRGDSSNAAFVGYSQVASDGVTTTLQPPIKGQWGWAKEFFRADLENYTPFASSIPLKSLFSERRSALEEYFDRNRARVSDDRRNIFFVRQSGRLQCLNGAYLSEVDDELFWALFGVAPSDTRPSAKSPLDARTGSQLVEVLARRGQRDFSDRIKAAFDHHCAFPGCDVDDRRFLVGSHIARWSDNAALRGSMGNGLCLCLVHDKAFELGLFLLEDDLTVRLNETVSPSRGRLWSGLLQGHGKPIRAAAVTPLPEALAEHRRRFADRKQEP